MSRRNRPLQSQSGMSELIALAIASAIGAVVIAATTTSFVQLNQGQQNVKQTADALDIKRDMEQMLSKPEACEANFRGLLASGEVNHETTVMDSDGVTNTPRFPVDEAIPGFDNIRIDHWTLSNATVVKTSLPVHQIVLLNLFLTKSDGAAGPKTIIRSVKLWSEKTSNTDSAIAKCYAIIGAGNDIWIRHADQNNIYNSNEDNVGVGTQSPAEKLHVSAGVPTTANMRASGPVTAQNFTARGNFDQTNNTAINSVLGRIGFGTNTPLAPLDVNGDARFNGNLTVAGSFTAPSVLLRNNLSVGTDLTVAGATNLSSVAVNGNTSFASTSLFQGDVRIDGPATMSQTFSVRGASVGTASLGITGSMVTTGLVTVPRVDADRFCIGSHCRTTFALQTCPAGTVTYRNNIDGTIGCTNISCPNGTFFRGMISVNQPDCQPLPTSICPTNSYITDYNAGTGTYTCRVIPPEVHVPNCVNGYLVGVNGGVPVCVPPQLIGGACGLGQAVVDINPDGSPICDDVFQNALTCSPGQVMTGFQTNGTPICSVVAYAATCSTNGQRLGSIMTNRTVNCDPVSVTGGSCPSGIRAISSTGTVTCF